MANTNDRLDALEENDKKQDTRIAVVETKQTNDSSRLKRIEGIQWFVAGTIFIAFITAMFQQLAK